MTAFKSPEIQEEVVANLIPMIDIMFLLLLFFMLGADMASREFEDVDLAPADSAAEDDKEDADRLTINIHHLSDREVTCQEFFTEKPEDQQMCRIEGGDWTKHWSITIRSERYPMKSEADRNKLKNKLQLEADGVGNKERDPQNPLLSNRRVQIRADKFAPFGFVRQVMESCASVGIYKLEVSASKPLPIKSS